MPAGRGRILLLRLCWLLRIEIRCVGIEAPVGSAFANKGVERKANLVRDEVREQILLKSIDLPVLTSLISLQAIFVTRLLYICGPA